MRWVVTSSRHFGRKNVVAPLKVWWLDLATVSHGQNLNINHGRMIRERVSKVGASFFIWAIHLMEVQVKIRTCSGHPSHILMPWVSEESQILYTLGNSVSIQKSWHCHMYSIRFSRMLCEWTDFWPRLPTTVPRKINGRMLSLHVHLFLEKRSKHYGQCSQTITWLDSGWTNTVDR